MLFHLSASALVVLSNSVLCFSGKLKPDEQDICSYSVLTQNKPHQTPSVSHQNGLFLPFMLLEALQLTL